MAPDDPLWIRCLLRVGALRGSEAALGDALEEYAGGGRGAFWLCRQILSTTGRRSRVQIQWGRSEMWSNLSSDTRYALRTFRRHPGFAAAAIAPIALGIGINTGIYSILDGLALRPVPAPKATELVSVTQSFEGVQRRDVRGSRSMFSVPEYQSYRDGTRTLSGLMGYSMPWTVTLLGDSPQQVQGTLVTCNYFAVLGLRLARGAGFTAADCEAGAAPVVIVGHELWTRAFAADSDIVRKTVTLNRQTFAVVGVAPERFEGIDMMKVAFFAPLTAQPALGPDADRYRDASTSWLSLVGRRTPEAPIAQVRAELAVIANQIDQQQPGRTTTVTVSQATALSLPEARTGILGVAAVVLAAFGLVLLMACANVANLLLARAAGRTREMAIRLSMGARRGRLVQQLLTESLLIALVGGAAGSILALWSFQGLLAVVLSMLPAEAPPLRIDAHPNLNVLWFAVALTVATGLVFGLAPALHASKQDLQTAMKQDSAGSGWRTRGWLRGGLLGVQVALCMVLLISAGLLTRGLYATQTVEPGFDYRDVAVVSLDLRGGGYHDRTAAAFQSRLNERLASLPGVVGVALAGKTPLSPGRTQGAFHLPGQDRSIIDVNYVSPEYFSLISVPIVAGRTFTREELSGGPRAVIVTEATARRYWPGKDPLGETLVMGGRQGPQTPLVVVGVAGDAQVVSVAENDPNYVYLPASPGDRGGLTVLVRSRGAFDPLASGIRSSVRELDPGLIVRVNRLEENLDFWRRLSGFVTGLAGSLSVLALVLASIGVYGVVSYVVSRRMREVGIRIVLGATALEVQRMILRQTLRPVVVGAAIGIAAAAASSRLLTSVLFGVSAHDPITFIGAPLFLMAVAAVASLSPVRSASRVDPMTTLRYE